MHIFFEENLEGDVVSLSQEESRHCVKVLRLQAGQEVGFANGKGTLATATLLDVNSKQTTAAIVKREFQPPRSFRLHMAVAPTKSIDRFEWFLEKAVECGIEEVTPIICSQSERRVIKPERLQKIMLAAMKQSRRHYLPLLNEAVKYNDFIKGMNKNTATFIAHCNAGAKISLRNAYVPGGDALILIGPEGDFSAEEVAQAERREAKAISLGESRLRTETAALVACMEVNFLNGEL